MPIENRNLEPGTKLIATYKKETYHALVVAGAEGKVLYQLSPYDGREFKSPSSLGTAVTGKLDLLVGGYQRYRGGWRDGHCPAATVSRRGRPRGARAGRPDPTRRFRRRSSVRGRFNRETCHLRFSTRAQPAGRPRGRGETVLQRLPGQLHLAIGPAARDLSPGALPRRCCQRRRNPELTIFFSHPAPAGRLRCGPASLYWPPGPW